MNILEKIVQVKRGEIANNKLSKPINELQKSEYYNQQCVSLVKALKTGNKCIISEFKRRSPSKGIIKEHADVANITKAYAHAGAECISVLTDQAFFGAEYNDFATARKSVSIPLLRKDFILDAYQVHETKAMGADIMLLIAAILTKDELNELHILATGIGLEVLVEIHEASELEKVPAAAALVGINNRDLKTFSVNTERSIALAAQLPSSAFAIAESGIDSIATMQEMESKGFSGFLIGEQFMKTDNPGETCANFVQALNKK